MPLISVIVPIYNSEKYLHRCIDSILGQTFEDFELILINDGSKDGSGTICDEYAKKDSRIKVIHKQNGGVSAARNDGLDIACGKYIMFVDSDDYVVDCMLENMQKDFSDDVDLVICSFQMYYQGKVFDNIFKDEKISAKELMTKFALEPGYMSTLAGPVCKLYRKEILYKNNVRFNVKMRNAEDTCFNMEYLPLVKNAAIKSDVYYFYMRENEDSLVSSYRPTLYNDLSLSYAKICDAIKVIGCPQQAIDCQKDVYINNLVISIPKAFFTATKKECISFMKQIAKDATFIEHFHLFKKNKKRYITVLMLKYKMFGLVYLMMSLKYRERKRGKLKCQK